MKKILTIAIIYLLFSVSVFAATEFNMTFDTSGLAGNASKPNVVAVWVTKSDGTFVKTIHRYANTRKSSLSTWIGAAGSSDADAVMGPTRNNHFSPSPMTVTWDLKDKSGVVVPDGNYLIKFECAEEVAGRKAHSFTFVKDSVAGTRTNAGTTWFKNISIAYAPPGPANTAPVANAQSVTNAEDTAKAITLTATDADSNPLTYAIVANPVHGTLSGTAPNVTYTPATNYYGSDSFTFKANDGTVDSTPATVSITVTPVNDAPVAQAQSVSTAEDTAKAITLVATDVETNALTYVVVASPSHGSLSGSAPNLIYTPATNYYGSDSFTFRASDASLTSATVIVSITVTAVNDAPVAQAQSVSTAEDTAKSITLVATDAESNTLTYAVVSNPAHGTLSGSAPNVTYTPATNYFGADSFTFKANDGFVDSASATISITVTAVNDAPVAQAQGVTTSENIAKSITLIATDIETNALIYSVVTGPSHGTLSGTAPNLTYTPAFAYTGSDSFTFKANDGLVDSAAATVSLTVILNNPPVANGQSVTNAEDTAVAITLVATDAESNSLTYVVVSSPSHGSLSGSAPNVTYTPSTNYYGSDSFTFKANDGAKDSSNATVSITVTAVNDAPVAQTQSVSTTEDTAKAITLVATDVETNSLTYSVVSGPSYGTLGPVSSNSVTYTPATNYFGSDSFTFKANDGALDSVAVTVSITVTAVNDAPVAQNQSISTAEDTAKSITLVATDAESNTLTYAVVSGPIHGTLSGSTPNVTYTPATNYYGSDSFTFSTFDGIVTGNTATVSITVTAVNDAPVAQAQSVSTTEDTAKAITLAATDVETNALTYTVVTSSAHGSLSGTAPNLTYTPSTNYYGSDSFTFKANDGTADSAATTVSITVTAVNDAPVAQAQSLFVAEDTPKAITLLATDVETNALTYTVVSNPTNGVLSGTAPNLIYTPSPTYNGPDSFTFKANDGALDSAVVTVSLSVIINNAPVANSQSVTNAEDTSVAITLTATDVESNALTYAIGTGPSHGTLSGSAPNVTYMPATNYFGSDSFTFKANDGTKDSAPATVSITVTAVNDVPSAQAQSVTTAEDTAKAITLAATDPESDPLTYAIVTDPLHGALTGTAPNVTYMPATNYFGSDSFTFRASDASVTSSPVTVSITVTAVNDAPVAQSQSVSTTEDTAKSITLIATDADGNTLTYVVINAPTNGTLSGSAPNVTYTPATNFYGSDSFTFSAFDGTVTGNIATVSIEVTSVNDAPVAQSQSVSTAEDTSKAITLVATDAETNALSYSVMTGPTHGSLSGTAPNVTYTPATNYYGSDSFTFSAFDGTVTGNIATVSITVTAVNDAPVAQAQGVYTSEDIAKAITLTATDVETNTLTYMVVSNPTNGVLSGAAPNLTYTPASAYTGPDSFTFKANDGSLDSAVVTVSITVLVNAAPVANSQSITNAEDTPIVITLVATDTETNTLTYAIVSGPTNGTLSGIAPNVTYTPATNYFGADSFTFKANDGAKDSSPATVLITVTAVNDVPVAQSQNVSTMEDVATNIVLVATDVETGSLIYTVVAGPAHGILSGTAPNLTYTPSANYYGSDSFTFKANDGTTDSVPAAVSITVVSVNNPPVAQPQSFSVQAGKSQSLVLNATDVDSAKLTYAIVSGPAYGTLSGTPPKVKYQPAKNYSGSDSFTFKANDGISDSDPATVSITVTATSSGGTQPVALSQSVAVAEDLPKAITLTGTDPQTNTLIYIVLKGPKYGTLSGSVPNLIYTPTTNYFGKDSFTFKVNNGAADSKSATVSIEVIGINDPPAVQDQGVVTEEDRSAKITLQASDSDSKKLTYTVLSGPTHGTLSGKAPKLAYQPAANYSGTDSFTFEVSDGIAEPVSATVFIVVVALNDAPVAYNQSVSVTENVPKSITLVGSDGDTNALTYAILKGPSHGTLSGVAPNLTYTPASDYSGKDKFTFSVSDGMAISKSATVSIVVTPVNTVPVAQDQSVSTEEDHSISIKLKATDADSKKLTYTIVSGPLHGTLSGTAPSLKYTPASRFNGADSFTFKANDGELDSDVATVYITVISDGDDDKDDDKDHDSDAIAQDEPLADVVPELTPQAAITVDGSVEDWAEVSGSPFVYNYPDGTNLIEITQEVAVALNGDNVALLLTGCPFSTSDTVLVSFKLLFDTGEAEESHSVDVWTSGSLLYGMVDGQVIDGFEAVLSEDGVLEIQFPVLDGGTMRVTLEGIACGMSIDGATLTELFTITPLSDPSIVFP
jgi:VCBS repeat-containing protein